MINRGQLSDSNWGAFDHASYVPQLLSDNYIMSVCACVCMCDSVVHIIMEVQVKPGRGCMYTLAPQLGNFNITHTQWEEQ